MDQPISLQNESSIIEISIDEEDIAIKILLTYFVTIFVIIVVIQCSSFVKFNRKEIFI